MIIVTATDRRFLKYTNAFLSSLLPNTTEMVYVMAVNMPELKSDGVHVFHQAVPEDSLYDKRAYGFKATAISRAFSLGSPVLWIDADSIVQKDMAPMCALFDNADILVRKDEQRPWKFKSCYLGFRHLVDAHRYQKLVKNDIYTYSDQDHIQEIVWNALGKSRIVSFPSEMCSAGPREGAVIWTTKKRSRSSEPYLSAIQGAEEILYE